MADIKYYGLESHFNENVTFNKDVNINGNLNYDSLTVRNLTVRERATLGVTTTTSLSAQSLNVSGISTLGNILVGGATTQLVVNGDVRITGILTVGTSSVTFDGTNNTVIVGTGVTIFGNTGIISATTFIKSGGTSAQYLRANGSSEELNITYGNNSGNTTYVYPPSGFVIGDLIGFIPSWRFVAYSGIVSGDDTSYCNYSIETGNNRVAVTCYTSEQRDTPQNNWFAIWRKTV